MEHVPEVSRLNWHSFHVYYYGSVKDHLVLEAVRPLFRSLDGTVERMYYAPHWLRGSHLRLNFQCTPGALATSVRPRVYARVGAFLERCPSPVAPVPAADVRMHRRLAEVEHEYGPLFPWHDDNSIIEAPFDRRVEMLGDAAELALVAEFHSDIMDLAFRMTEAIVAGTPRWRIGFDLLCALAASISKIGLKGGFMAFRAHAEGFLTGYQEGRALRPRWDDYYGRNRAQFVGRLEEVVAFLGNGEGHVPFVTEWLSLIFRYMKRAEILVAEGKMRRRATSKEEVAFIAQVGRNSAFHREMSRNEAWREILASDSFIASRVVLNLAYAHLTRLGIDPSHRHFICHALANATEESLGVSAEELVGQVRYGGAGDAG
ncbi:thiopeptide maturation pyridine synthase [[Actinomadura] parvosata]|uniref:thiopeptide maturation pyridine synthase n=1 Tax=[Actinomadura] parvosata TaxID=1955412 RepID=UPI00406C369E